MKVIKSPVAVRSVAVGVVSVAKSILSTPSKPMTEEYLNHRLKNVDDLLGLVVNYRDVLIKNVEDYNDE